MVDTLDQRMARQLQLVKEVLEKRGMTEKQLRHLTKEEANELDDQELRLCWHVLRDIDYIDSLR